MKPISSKAQFMPHFFSFLSVKPCLRWEYSWRCGKVWCLHSLTSVGLFFLFWVRIWKLNDWNRHLLHCRSHQIMKAFSLCLFRFYRYYYIAFSSLLSIEFISQIIYHKFYHRVRRYIMIMYSSRMIIMSLFICIWVVWLFLAIYNIALMSWNTHSRISRGL